MSLNFTRSVGFPKGSGYSADNAVSLIYNDQYTFERISLLLSRNHSFSFSWRMFSENVLKMISNSQIIAYCLLPINDLEKLLRKIERFFLINPWFPFIVIFLEKPDNFARHQERKTDLHGIADVSLFISHCQVSERIPLGLYKFYFIKKHTI